MKTLKTTKPKFILFTIITTIIGIFLLQLLYSAHLPGDPLTWGSQEIGSGFAHVILNVICTIFMLAYFIISIIILFDCDELKKYFHIEFKGIDYDDDDDDTGDTGDKKENQTKKKRNYSVAICVGIIILALFIYAGINIGSSMSFMYNKSKIYHNTYQQKIEEKQGVL